MISKAKKTLLDYFKFFLKECQETSTTLRDLLSEIKVVLLDNPRQGIRLTDERLRSIISGKEDITREEGETIVKALGIPSDYKEQKRRMLEAVEEVSFESQSLSQHVEELVNRYGTKKNLLEKLDLCEGTINSACRLNRFRSLKVAIVVTNEIGLTGQRRKDFLERSGGFYESYDDVIEALKDNRIDFPEALKAMTEIHPLGSVKIAERLEIPKSTYTTWCRKRDERMELPPHNILEKLAGKNFFRLNRKQSEAFFRAANDFIDLDHVFNEYKAENIPRNRALYGIICLEYGSNKIFSKAIKKSEGLVAVWTGSGEAVPNTHLKTLCNDMKRCHAEKTFEIYGRYYDYKHIIRVFRNKDNYPALIEAIQTTFDITVEDLGLDVTAFSKHQLRMTQAKPHTIARIYDSVLIKEPVARLLKNIIIESAGNYFYPNNKVERERFCNEIEKYIEVIRKKSISDLYEGDPYWLRKHLAHKSDKVFQLS